MLWIGVFLFTGSSSIAQDDHTPDSTSSTTTDSVNRPTPVTLRTIPDSTIHRFKKDDNFAYANDPAYWQKEDDRSNSEGRRANWFLRTLAAILQSKGFKYFIFILLTAILGFALYKIMAENNWRIFQKSSPKSRTGGEENAEITEEDLEANLRKALLDKDFRMSVRYLFLKSLHLLNDHGMIRLRMQATNKEYIDQMKEHPQAGSFLFLENAYDHVWYGGFLLSEPQFEWLHQYFQDFYKSLDA